MKKQELCQLLETELKECFNLMIINDIANYIWVELSKQKETTYDAFEELKDTFLFKNWIQKLKDGIPIQYVLHNSCFYGIDFEVNEDVLIPRPETEELVSWILCDEKSADGKQVLDIGTGSGCIPIVLKMNRPEWEVSSIDISQTAINVAKRNALAYNLDIQFSQIDFLKENSLLEDSFDLIISNPPYIAKNELDDISTSVLSFEPLIALFPTGDDPLIFYRVIASWAKKHLKKTGSMYFELNEFLYSEIEQIFQDTGYSKMEVREDMQGKKRMLKVQF